MCGISFRGVKSVIIESGVLFLLHQSSRTIARLDMLCISYIYFDYWSLELELWLFVYINIAITILFQLWPFLAYLVGLLHSHPANTFDYFISRLLLG